MRRTPRGGWRTAALVAALATTLLAAWALGRKREPSPPTDGTAALGTVASPTAPAAPAGARAGAATAVEGAPSTTTTSATTAPAPPSDAATQSTLNADARRAALALSAGDFRQALAHYRALARSGADAKVHAEIARILTARLAADCGPNCEEGAK